MKNQQQLPQDYKVYLLLPVSIHLVTVSQRLILQHLQFQHDGWSEQQHWSSESS